MQVFNIVDAADQQFSAILNERRVTFRLRYNPVSERWSVDIAVDDVPVVHGRRIVPNVDLLAPYHLGLGSLFAVVIMPGAEADRQGLPTGAVRLYHATQDEIDAAISA